MNSTPPGADERLQRALDAYHRSVYGGDASDLVGSARELDALEADLALARGRLLHASFLERRTDPDPAELELFERAARLYQRLRDPRGEGAALFWTGVYHQIVQGDSDLAVPMFERSRDLAHQAGDVFIRADALRHLGIAAHFAGRLSEARDYLAESTRLRREIGFLPGVASNLVGLAYVAAQDDRPDDLRLLLNEAAELAQRSGADGVARTIDEARANLGVTSRG